MIDNFEGTIKNIFYAKCNLHLLDNELIALDINSKFYDETFENDNQSTFDMLQIEWQEAGKYRGE